jgi:hypothetical protein
MAMIELTRSRSPSTVAGDAEPPEIRRAWSRLRFGCHRDSHVVVGISGLKPQQDSTVRVRFPPPDCQLGKSPFAPLAAPQLLSPRPGNQKSLDRRTWEALGFMGSSVNLLQTPQRGDTDVGVSS